MKTVKKEAILPFIEADKLCYFNEYKSIMEEPCVFYAADDKIGPPFLMLQSYPYGLLASFIGFHDGFFIQAISELEKNHPTIHIVIPMPSSQYPNMHSNPDNLIKKGVYKSFACCDRIPSLNEDRSIRSLTGNDQAIVSSFQEEKHSNMIQLDTALEEFVINGNGEIYAYFDANGKIIGYLSCAPELYNIWDVVYIYVQPEFRSTGIGTKLASHYLNAKLKANQIPYYSGVTNAASEAAAIKAGFTLCGTRYCYEYHK